MCGKFLGANVLKSKTDEMRYCAISVCRNNSKKRPDLSFFDFPSDKKLRKKWSTFCRRADKEFQSTANLHICSEHFNTNDIVKTLCGIKKVVNGALPTIFNPKEVPSGTSEREKRMISRRGKRNLRDESDLKFPAKSPRVSSDVALKNALPNRIILTNGKHPGCLPFVRVNRLGRALNNGKGFSKIAKPTERNGAYHLQFDFSSLFSADERLETGKFCKW